MLPTTSARRWRKVATQGAQSYIPCHDSQKQTQLLLSHVTQNGCMYVITEMLLKMYPCWRHNILGFFHWTCYYPAGSLQTYVIISPWFLPDYIQSEVKKNWRDTNRYDLRPSTVDDSDFFQWWFHFERTPQHSKRKRWGLLHPIFWHKKNISM